jgi:hypothetical protein
VVKAHLDVEVPDEWWMVQADPAEEGEVDVLVPAPFRVERKVDLASRAL